MAEQPRPVNQRPPESSPDMHRTAKFLTAVTLGSILLSLSGITFTGTVISLIIATPILVLLSPILVPAAIVIFITTSGFVLSTVFAAVAVSVMSWMYRYIAGKHPPGSERLDYARMRLANKARDVKERAIEYGQHVQNKVQEVKSQEPKAQEAKTQETKPKEPKVQEAKSQEPKAQTPKARAS